jgi:hypothetical protein
MTSRLTGRAAAARRNVGTMAAITEETYPDDGPGAVRTRTRRTPYPVRRVRVPLRERRRRGVQQADAVAAYFNGCDAEGNFVSSGMGFIQRPTG